MDRATSTGFSIFLRGVVAALTVTSLLTTSGAFAQTKSLAHERPVAPAAIVPEFAPDRLIVKFKLGLAAAAKAQGLERVGARVQETFRSSGASVLELGKKSKDVRAVAKELQASGLVEYAEPDYVRNIGATFPSDPQFRQLWGQNNEAQAGGTRDADIDAPEAWDITTGSAQVVVGVIDTGIDYTHEDLAANVWRNPGEVPSNGIDDDRNGYVDDVHGIDCINGTGNPFDDHGHGTHVSGTIGGVANNGRGVTGVSWNVRVMGLKFLDANGSGYTSAAIRCLQYATDMKTRHGVNLKLTSNSWGGGGYDQSLRDAIQAAATAGMLFVAAAANDASDIDIVPVYPAAYDVPEIVSVGCTDSGDRLCYFSNYGARNVDLFAPGLGILSTVPGNGYASYSGTSMSTPHVSGVAALIWARQPAASPLDVKQAILTGADPVPALAGLSVTGARLNAFRSLTPCDANQATLSFSLSDGFRLVAGAPETVTVGLRTCTAPLLGATVGVATSDGRELVARDDGLGGDAAANDGSYTTVWSPSSVGTAAATATAGFSGGTLQASATGSVIGASRYSFVGTRFKWVEAGKKGFDLGLSDDVAVDVPIGFPFPYYGQTYETVRVSSNGFLAFGAGGSEFGNEALPSASAPNGVVAPYWDDLNPSVSGRVLYLPRGKKAGKRQLTIQWDQVAYFEDGLPVTFQVTLFDTGAIRFQYLNVASGSSHDFGASATIGIEDAAGQSGETFSFDQPSVTDGTALLVVEQ